VVYISHTLTSPGSKTSNSCLSPESFYLKNKVIFLIITLSITIPSLLLFVLKVPKSLSCILPLMFLCHSLTSKKTCHF
jgi:hypothetical protein